MIEVTFSLKNCENEPQAAIKFRAALKLLEKHGIPYQQEVVDELYSDNHHINISSKRTIYVVHRIFFEKEEDYLTYLIIKD